MGRKNEIPSKEEIKDVKTGDGQMKGIKVVLNY